MNIDHFVWATPDLDKGVSFITDQLGVKPIPGGLHPGKGTHNAIVPLDHGTYLEIIAPTSPDVIKCWMDIHLITEPQVIRWALRSTSLGEELKSLGTLGIHMGSVLQGKRVKEDGTVLNWELTDPDTFRTEKIIPFLIDWRGGTHPTTGMRSQCQLINVRATHPDSQRMKHVLTQLAVKIDVEEGAEPSLNISIRSPGGIAIL